MSTNRLFAYASKDDQGGKRNPSNEKKKGSDKKKGKGFGAAPTEPNPARTDQPDEEKEGG